jgi:hypothetical protein
VVLLDLFKSHLAHELLRQDTCKAAILPYTFT